MNESYALNLIRDVVERQGKILRLENSPLRSLPPLPNHIEQLYVCKCKEITELPALPINLTEFACDGTSVKTIPTLPLHLQRLNCASTQVEYLPSLPQTLISLNIYNSQLKELPALPEVFLTTLMCGKTNLTEFPSLPNSLHTLDCSETRITKLPQLPQNLIVLDMYKTPIRELPERFPESLQWLTAYQMLLPDKLIEETPNDYVVRVKKFQQFIATLKPIMEEHICRRRCIARCKAVKEELMAATWHTDRVLEWCDPNAFSWED